MILLLIWNIYPRENTSEANCLDSYQNCEYEYTWDSTHTNIKTNILYLRWLTRKENYRLADSLYRSSETAYLSLDKNSEIRQDYIFHKLLNKKKVGILTVSEIDLAIDQAKKYSKTLQINLLQTKSSLLRDLSDINYSFATALYAEYLYNKLNNLEKDRIYNSPWVIHTINLQREHFRSKASIHFLKKFNQQNLNTPEMKWMYLLYRTGTQKLNLDETNRLQKRLINDNYYAPRFKDFIETHLAYSCTDRNFSIELYKNKLASNPDICNYNRAYLIDSYLVANNLKQAKIELDLFSKCQQMNISSEFEMLYFYRKQQYDLFSFKASKKTNYLLDALSSSISVINAFNDHTTSIVNTHYADVIYLANNVLFESLYLLQNTSDRVSKEEIVKFLYNSKRLYSQISDSRNILKNRSLNDEQFGKISKIHFRISQNELQINNYQDTLFRDMSIYEDIYNDYINLNKVLTNIKNTPIAPNKQSSNLISNSISKKDLILDFVKTDSCYFMFNLSENSYKIEKLKLSLVENSINNIRTYLQKKNELNEEAQQFITLIKKQIKPHTKHIYVVPDGILFAIPLEIIQPKILNDTFNISISYLSNSGDYYNFTEKILSPIISLFSFSDQSTLLKKSKLIISEQQNGYIEAKKISKKYNNSTLIAGRNMTNKNIFANYKVPILHFSSHSYSSTTNQLNNYIYTRDSQNGNAIPSYGFQFKSKPLNNNLVILSACNSGTGVQKPGTGVFSLSRDFLQAGAQTVIKSLWAVNEASTKELMVLFHTYFTQGESAGEALAHAKRTVKKDPKYTHPYYWAGFVLEGNPHIYLDTDSNNVTNESLHINK